MSVDLRHIRYVLAAADQSSIRKAARVLRVRESTVSRAIRDFEDSVGATLFRRHSGGVDLTYAGERFVRRARQALNQLCFAVRETNAIGRAEEGTVRIGILSSLASGFLADLLLAYETEHSKVHMAIEEGTHAAHFASIQRHELDIAFVTGDAVVEGCDAMRFWTERVFVVLPRDHHLADRKELFWCDLRGLNFVVSKVDPGPAVYNFLVRGLSGIGWYPNIDRAGVGRHNLMRIVSLGRRLTLASEAMTAAQFPDVVFKVLSGEELPFTGVWSPTNSNPAFRRFLSTAMVLSRRRQSAP